MKKIFLFILILINVVCAAQVVQITNIKVLNLEEDKGPFATLNDEILLLTVVYSQNNDSLYYWHNTDILEFTDSLNNYDLNIDFNFNKDTSTYLMIAIIEIDDYVTSDFINQQILEKFDTFKLSPQLVLQENIEETLTDNDLLGFSIINYKEIFSLEKVINYEGMQLFNKFHYQLSVQVN